MQEFFCLLQIIKVAFNLISLFCHYNYFINKFAVRAYLWLKYNLLHINIKMLNSTTVELFLQQNLDYLL